MAVRASGSVGENQRTVVLALTEWLNEALLACRYILRAAPGLGYSQSNVSRPGHGTTVLVTTGRQAKTLVTVRALKAIGCRVVVTDYERVSASATSVDCDVFAQLPPLATTPPHEWVRVLRAVLEKYEVNIVIPVSTINEVLPMALAKDTLSDSLPNVQWICPGLEAALALDDRAAFAVACQRYGVPAPASAVLTSRDGVREIAACFRDGVVFKRIESSVNRAEEVVIVPHNAEVPDCVVPSRDDPWQWQRFVRGTEMSVWYIVIAGRVTFRACYKSRADLTEFDPVDVPPTLDVALRRLIAGMCLTGQYAFDFIVDRHGTPFVLECNPRASSILETVSTTPDWAEAFFGVDVTSRTVRRSVGFMYHRNAWPWQPRRDVHWETRDPLPFIVAQGVWPIHAVAKRALSGRAYKVDVNICKIITKGASPARNIAFYRDALADRLIELAEDSAQSADTLIVDLALRHWDRIVDRAHVRGVKVVLLSYDSVIENHANACDSGSAIHQVAEHEVSNEFFAQFVNGETRAILGEALSRRCGSSSPVTYRLVTRRRTLEPASELPLRRRRVLHLIGSCSSEFYAGVSTLYGFQCIELFNKPSKYEHFVAFVYRNGEWSVDSGNNDLQYFENTAQRLCIGEALTRIQRLAIDVVQPHLFDQLGMTAYRSLFDTVSLPILGCSADAMALSLHKVRTKAVAASAGVPVAASEVLSAGEKPKMAPPFVVKPVEEDNSVGVTLVRHESELEHALKTAFEVDDTVMCERYIELGRELRVALVENADGDLEMLPILEYLLSADNPIREVKDKLASDNKGVPNGLAKKRTQLPATVDDRLRAKLLDAAVRAHRALGCRDYSIFDVRVDPHGEPYILESCLYCSFSANSVIVSLARAKGIEADILFERMLDWAIGRRKICNGAVQQSGMKLKS